MNGRKFNTLRKISVAKALAVFCVLIFLIFPNFINAKTFNQYKETIRQLKIEFAALLVPGEDFSDEETSKNIEAVFERTLKLLPAEEKVEVEATTFDVNNKWIAEKIEEYNIDEKTSEDRELILTSIYERLEAIELKLKELENSLKSETGKDSEKRKLSEILKREEFQKPEVEEESLLQKIWNWFDEWMNENFRPQTTKPLPPSNFGSIAYIMQILLYGIIIGIIGFLIYKFAPFLVKKFRERERREKKKERYILGEKLAADETSENLFSEAETLALQGNLREAIRKGYIALLFELSERKLIGLAKHKTNRDYLRSVQTKRELYENMNGLTSNYERHWYGFENADETDWNDFKVNYKKALGVKK
jgi:hypothetical protein